MKFIIALLALSGMACASNPYKACHDETDIYESQSSRNACIQAVQQQEQQKANLYYSHPQMFQVAPVQAQAPYQMPVSRPTNTTCTMYGNQMNCIGR